MKMRLLPKDRNLGWTPFAWLIYLIPYIIMAWERRDDAATFASNAAGLVAFLALYFRSYWVSGRGLMAIVAAVAFLGVALGGSNPFAAVFFIYGAAMIGFIDRAQPRLRQLGFYLILVTLYGLISKQPIEFFIPAVLIAGVIGGVNIHYAQVWIANAKVRLAQSEVERLAKMAERERIARDLHDVLGHTLSVVALKSELAGKLLERDPARAGQEIREVHEIAREALSQVRAAVTGYRSAGLSAEFEAMRKAFASAGVELEVEAERLNLPASHENALALALREASTNVLRHARASHCRVKLVNRNGVALLEIVDDGRGGANQDGNGLLGMRERIAALGGSLSRDGRDGMRLEISLPLPQPSA